MGRLSRRLRRKELARRLRRSEHGVAAVEFGIVAPLVLMTMMGLFDLGYNIYTEVLLEGAIQKAARNSTIEGAWTKTAQLDAVVTDAVHDIAPHATLKFERTAYASFAKVGRPEDFTDVNKDGRCNSGEPFEDANGNGTWDADQGKAGTGSARDAVLYEVTITYPRAFPVSTFLGMDPNFSMLARTVLRNQPYDLVARTAKIGKCS